MKQSGNALFLILIAVALFAALSYAVTQSGRGGANVDRETARIQAANLIEVAGYWDSALDRFMLLNGYSIQDVSLWNGVNFLYRNTPEFPVQQQLFHESGGGETFPATPPGTDGWFFTGSSGVPGFGVSTSCSGANPCSELVIGLGGIPYEVCKAINDIEGIVNPGGDPPTDLGDFESVPYRASTTLTSGSHQFNAMGGANDGKAMGCLETLHAYRGGPDKYFFYYVLMTDIWQ